MKSKKNRSKLQRLFIYFSGFALSLLAVFPIFSPSVDASSVTQSYGASSTIQPGVIVQLVPNKTSDVEPVSLANIKQTFGVVINSADSTLSLSNSSSAQQIYVANSGDYNVLVSDQNGSISIGNYVTVSNIDGVGMKADSTQPIIVGQALQVFNIKSNYIGSQVIKNSNGNEQTVHLGLISVRISIAQNPLLKSQSTPLPSYLQRFSFYAVGKVVSPLRIYLGLGILVIVLIITASMIVSATKNSLIGLGRNPLSRKVITKGFLELVFIALIILISGVFGVYLLLKV